MQETRYDLLSEVDKELVDSAAIAMERAYNPLSKFYVGAALLSQNRQIITGSNVEVSSYTPTICAERAAIVRANAMGIRLFDKIAIIARGRDFDTEKVTAPCGVCRQELYDFAQLSGGIDIIMSTTKKDKIVVSTIEELLPLGFGPKDLGVDIDEYR